MFQAMSEEVLDADACERFAEAQRRLEPSFLLRRRSARFMPSSKLSGASAAMTPVQPTATLDLALALIGSSDAPVLLLDGELTVIAASRSFCEAFALSPARVTARPLFEVGAGEWDAPGLRSLLAATISGDAKLPSQEMDLTRPEHGPRRLVIKAHLLDYGDPTRVRIMLAVSDVTDERSRDRLRDELLREKSVLLQEVQHRIANSLQIIASVLMQSARKVQSEETRVHLRDAHNRVMSIAAVQQQLAASALGDVEMEPYLQRLCSSLGASMIHDRDRISIAVRSDAAAVSANVSVHLGLITTELVINALKHAFPRHRKGGIKVEYSSSGPDWRLEVSDDGCGMPREPGRSKLGLGTGIVEALSRQLRARVEVRDADPGTCTSLVHDRTDAQRDRPLL